MKKCILKGFDCGKGCRNRGHGVGRAKSGARLSAARSLQRRAPSPKPPPGAGPAPTWGRTKGGHTCGGAGAWGGRRARTWVSAAPSLRGSVCRAPATAKMARSEDASRPMSHGGGPPELLPGQVRPGRPRRREAGAGGPRREHSQGWGRRLHRARVVAGPRCGRDRRDGSGGCGWALRRPRWLPWRPPAPAPARGRGGGPAPEVARADPPPCRVVPPPGATHPASVHSSQSAITVVTVTLLLQ